MWWKDRGGDRDEDGMETVLVRMGLRLDGAGWIGKGWYWMGRDGMG